MPPVTQAASSQLASVPSFEIRRRGNVQNPEKSLRCQVHWTLERLCEHQGLPSVTQAALSQLAMLADWKPPCPGRAWSRQRSRFVWFEKLWQLLWTKNDYIDSHSDRCETYKVLKGCCFRNMEMEMIWRCVDAVIFSGS